MPNAVRVTIALVIALLALTSPAAIPDLPTAAKAPVLWRSPAVAAAQALPSKAGLVVRFGDGRTETRCVDFAEPQISGFELLRRSGLPVEAAQGQEGTAVCKISGEGCDRSNCLTCNGRYWSYFHLVDGAWRYSQIGSAAYQVRAGAVDGWSFSNGVAPPTSSFATICSSAASTATTPAVRPTDIPVTSGGSQTRPGAAPLPIVILGSSPTVVPPAPSPAAPSTAAPSPTSVVVGAAPSPTATAPTPAPADLVASPVATLAVGTLAPSASTATPDSNASRAAAFTSGPAAAGSASISTATVPAGSTLLGTSTAMPIALTPPAPLATPAAGYPVPPTRDPRTPPPSATPTFAAPPPTATPSAPLAQTPLVFAASPIAAIGAPTGVPVAPPGSGVPLGLTPGQLLFGAISLGLIGYLAFATPRPK